MGSRSEGDAAAGSLVARLQSVQSAGDLPAAQRDAVLIRSLRDRSNYVAQAAAEQLGHTADWGTCEALISEFEWFMADGHARDGGCHVRVALARIFGDQHHQPAETALRAGLSAVQVEPVGGVPFDTAAHLRAACALALAGMAFQGIACEAALLITETERFDPVIGKSGSTGAEPRRTAATALSTVGGEAAEVALEIASRAPGLPVEAWQDCVDAMAAMRHRRLYEAVEPVLRAGAPSAAMYACATLVEVGDERCIPWIRNLLPTLDRDLRNALVDAVCAARQDSFRRFATELEPRRSQGG